ncbi:MAG TPA: hypothetical protein VIK35_09075 [Verrucomicrobiae bacterium]
MQHDSISPCPPASNGVHSWQLSAAHYCRRAGMSPAEAESFIAARITRPPKPANEIAVAVARAFNSKPPCHPRNYNGRYTAPKKITDIQFEPAKLRAVAARISPPRNWRHWLWERSPKRPETQNAFSFLAQLYAPGELVHVFDKMDSKTPLATVAIKRPMDCRVPALIRGGGNFGDGIWYLCNPVDGQWHPNPRDDNKLSCRSEESITAFRYAVLESDQAAPDDWLAFVAQLPIKIAAIYSSGSRSIHCLIRLDAKTKAEWDSQIQPLKRPLKLLGADAACLSAVRLTRLPGCWRPNKNGFQRLLYLCPNPSATPLIELPVIQSRADMLARWRKLCPRWNFNQEANQ